MQIKEICDKYDIDGVYERFASSCDEKIEVGFLGEFSSGKSSLLNSILEQDLLVTASKPTTKTAVSVGFGEEEKFFKTKDGYDVEIDRDEFTALQTASGEYRLKAQILVGGGSSSLNFIYIDTPGVSSLDKLDFDITFGYLPRLECAIVCQDINQGELTQSILNFISQNPEILANIIFAITKSDSKSAYAAQKIKAAVLAQLSELLSDADARDIESRIVFTDAKSQNLELKELINEHFYKKFEALKAKKIVKYEIKTKKELLAILKDRLENTGFSIAELDAKAADINAKIAKLKEDISKQKINLNTYLKNIEIKIKNAAVKSADLLKEGDAMGFSEEIINVVESNVSEYFNGRLHADDGLVDISYISGLIEKINFRKQILDALPKVLYATGSFLNKNNNDPRLKVAIEVALKKGVEVLGSRISDFFTDRSYKSAVDDIANLITAATKKYIEDFANEQIFAPLEINLNNELDSANDILRLKKDNIDSVNALKEQLKNDIWDLEVEVAGK